MFSGPFIIRALSSLSSKAREVVREFPQTMSAWQIKGYNGFESLEMAQNVIIPPIIQPRDVLVEVKSASINAIDVMMSGKTKQL